MRWGWLTLPLLSRVTGRLLDGTSEDAGDEDPIATHIRHGLDLDSATPDESAAATDSALNSTASAVHHIATGSGNAFASSCQAALWSWKQASETYGSQHGTNTSTTVSGSLYATYTYTDFTAGVSASRTTRLCDGYPRVIGSGSYEDIETSTISFSAYSVSTSVPGTYTTPPPCSIGPSDCAVLWKSFASSTAASLVFENKSVLEPPCQTQTANTTIPFETAACVDKYGPGPGIVGSQVRLLYWPVRTAEAETPDSYFCTRYVSNNVTPTYLTGTRTGAGPNTFVTGDLTITSPTVAISFSGLHRQDGCGPTVDNTILTLPTSLLSSVRGARAAYGWYPFNLADLNWRCESPSGTFTVQDTNETTNGAECFQDVAAQAYWGAAPQVDYARGAGGSFYSSLTIMNNYRPYVIPDQRVGSEMRLSLWGSTATWWIDGIWDPPLALTEASQESLPTLPAGDGAVSITSASEYEVLTTPAMPAHTMTTKIASTGAVRSASAASALADSDPSLSNSGNSGAEPSGMQPSRFKSAEPQSPGTQAAEAQSSETQPHEEAEPTAPGHDASSSDRPGAAYGSGSVASPSYAQSTPSQMSSVTRQTSVVTTDKMDQPAVRIPGKSSEISWNSHTLTVGGAAWTTNEQVVTAAGDGLVVRPQSGASSETTIRYVDAASIDDDQQTATAATRASEASNDQTATVASASESNHRTSGSTSASNSPSDTGASNSIATKGYEPAFPVALPIVLFVISLYNL